ncbi:MAG: dihydroorotate dehydrogenase [Actinomycetota bacterium]
MNLEARTEAAVDMSVSLAGARLRSPVVTASGCFASGREVAGLMDLRQIGAVTVKSMTLRPWPGKPTPRMVETPSGMLNAIGLQGKGVDFFLSSDLPWLHSLGVPVIASIAGNTLGEFVEVARRLSEAPGIVALEVNISCPNLEDRNHMFAHDPRATARVIAGVRASVGVPVFAKLSPNVTSLVSIAEAALEAGAEGFSLINTVLGMAIDLETGRPSLAGVIGGLSGPAIRPIAVRAIFEVHRAFPSVPIIGMGGVMDHRDALELVLAGASAIAVGTANFIDPRCMLEIHTGMQRYLAERGIRGVSELVGAVKVPG